MAHDDSTLSTYLRYLPSIYAQANQNTSLYLKIFEKILSGIVEDEREAARKLAEDDGQDEKNEQENALLEQLAQRGLGELLDVVADFFFPRFSFLFPGNKTFLPELKEEQIKEIGYYVGEHKTPEAWLDAWLGWVAGWVALVLDQTWDVQYKREVLARVLPLYRKRGTRRGLLKMLDLYLGWDTTLVESITVVDTFKPPPRPIRVGAFVVKNTYTPGDAVIGGTLPFCFLVTISLKKTRDPVAIQQVEWLAHRIIRQEMPAHARYRLDLLVVTVRVGTFQVGKNSLLGNWDGKKAENSGNR